MKETYTKLMIQQHTSEISDATFFKKLEQAGRKPNRAVWKAAAAAACFLLLIPVTVWAAESIFGIITVAQLERPTYDNKPGIGIDIQYENLEHHELEDFSPQVQELKESEIMYHESWQDAERYWGLDLLKNPLFTAEDTKRMTPFDGEKLGQRAHCTGIYRVADGQFYAGSIYAGYRRNNVEFLVGAEASAQHPSNDRNIASQSYHDTSITYIDRNNTRVDTQQYTTAAGIPVLIVTVTEDTQNTFDSGFLECAAYFAVNNISYTISYCGGSYDPHDSAQWATQAMGVITEVLDGFVLE